jgi:ABC-2 type transport system ATP-binding protein
MIGVEKSFPITPFSKKKILHNIDLTVRRGVSFGFLGPNGAGKSTAIKLLLNFLVPDTGEMYVNGKKVGQQEFRTSIGYLPEYPCFYGNVTARETLSYVGKLSGMKKEVIKERMDYLLDQVKLTDAASLRIKTFSKGMKQRLGIACAMIHDPSLLIFDEPMSGLDPVGRHLVKKIISNLCSEGKTVFFSTHILADISELCASIGVIHRGHILYQGSLQVYQEGCNNLEEAFIRDIDKWEAENNE